MPEFNKYFNYFDSKMEINVVYVGCYGWRETKNSQWLNQGYNTGEEKFIELREK